MSTPSPDAQDQCHDAGDGFHRPGYHEDKKRYLARLKRIEGQTRGIHRMIAEDEYCIDILTQVAAVNSALENVALALLEDHLSHCMRDAAANDGELAEDKITEAMAAVRRMVKS
ncbi:transcriptional regulator [Corynebacterium yudongzhengii]|uniref:Metal-sensitive transcriptional regulator n=1 Tax=Corynebacterium yudongzhengii TaxID=2080740 RepID=A0A2U1T5M7_9CORY|nr:transcriptional regulator [Corynebacterium yudongzhengii]PWC01311.1 metal-sensitive transcriptional regulator [Corynebacterium yudongzhengii]